MKKITIIIICFYISMLNSFSQHKGHAAENLLQYAIQKGKEWRKNKAYADSLGLARGIPLTYIDEEDHVVILQRFEKGKPVYYKTENLMAAQTLSVPSVWPDGEGTYDLTGTGVCIGEWDGGRVLGSHIEFSDSACLRIVQIDYPQMLSNHSTHVAGTMISRGADSDAKGMAGKAILNTYDYNNDIYEMAKAAYEGLHLSNHSYGPMVGWMYSGSMEEWYWFGDTVISGEEDYSFGFYDDVAQSWDYIACQAPYYLMIKSAGNDRNEGPENQPAEHYIWEDDWKGSTTVRDLDGDPDGFDCLTPMATAKNVLVVGAVYDLPDGYEIADSVKMTPFSSWGPTDDGRIKPDVVANGATLYSTLADDDNAYGTYSGSSMASASASGGIALLLELQENMLPGVELLSSSLRGLIIHTADEAGTFPGPDYMFGWGLINIRNAADVIYHNAYNGGKNIIEDVLDEGGVFTHSLTVDEATEKLTITLCWTDPPGVPSDPQLDPLDKKLINDLDIKLVSDQTAQSFFPWVLNPGEPDDAAETDNNARDNVERIDLDDPLPVSYTLTVTHKENLEGGIQPFSLIITGRTANSNLEPPTHLTYEMDKQDVTLFWGPPLNVSPAHYHIYRNGSLVDSCETNQYADAGLDYGTEYRYYVTSHYTDVTGGESVGTNTVTVMPVVHYELPYWEDFENGVNNWDIMNTPEGWQVGTSEELSSYYLDFSANEGTFLAISSYAAGENIMVRDGAISPVLDLQNHTDVYLSFDYLFKTGIYEAIDELHVKYKKEEDNNWIELENVEAAFSWKNHKIALPDEMLDEGIQIGFFYDDFYKWGMGAGIDNVYIYGTEIITVHAEPSQSISEVDIWPVPAKDKLYFIVPENIRGQLQLELINPAGQIIRQMLLKSVYSGEKYVLDVEGIPSAVYYLRIIHHSFLLTIPFVIQ